MLLASIFLVQYYPLQLPVWGLFLALAIALIFLIPCGIISAITNVTIGGYLRQNCGQPLTACGARP